MGGVSVGGGGVGGVGAGSAVGGGGGGVGGGSLVTQPLSNGLSKFINLQITRILLSANISEVCCLGLRAVRPSSQRGAIVILRNIQLPGLDFILSN